MIAKRMGLAKQKWQMHRQNVEYLFVLFYLLDDLDAAC